MVGLVNREGLVTAAAYGATLQLWNYVQMPALAVGAAVSAMVAQNIGAHRWDRVGAITNSGMAINFGMTGVLIALLLAFARPALSLFLGSVRDAIEGARHRSDERRAGQECVSTCIPGELAKPYKKTIR